MTSASLVIYFLTELDYVGVHVVIHKPSLLYPLEPIPYRWYVLLEPVVELHDVIFLSIEPLCPVRFHLTVVVGELSGHDKIVPVFVHWKSQNPHLFFCVLYIYAHKYHIMFLIWEY